MNGYTESELNRIAKSFGLKSWTKLATMPNWIGKRQITEGSYVGFYYSISHSQTHEVLGTYKGYFNGMYWFSNL